jgi:outer membrane immunogenic protein
MTLKFFAAAALITLGTLGSATAADMSAPAPAYRAPPPPLPVYNWTGCYVGGGGGYAFWQQDSFVVSPGGAPLTASQSNGGKGWFGQGQVGCDYQFTAPYFGVQTVIGAFSDIEGGSIDGTSSFPGFTGRERESSTWAVGGRAGVLVTPRFLTYFDGGFTQARFDGVNYNFNPGGGGPSGLSLAAQTYNGWFIGSGFEYAFDWLPISGLFPQDRISLFAVRRQRRECAVNGDRRRRGRSGYRCRAQLAEGHRVHLDRTRLALQLVRPLI